MKLKLTAFYIEGHSSRSCHIIAYSFDKYVLLMCQTLSWGYEPENNSD
jgi:hypothetical protein